MIDWKNVKDLHVIQKIEEIIGKWFAVDLFYVDQHGEVHGDVISNKDHNFYSHFFKVQLKLPHGQEYIHEDIQKGFEQLKNSGEECFYFESYFPGVRAIASKVEVDGEFSGAIFAYPYIPDHRTQDEIQAIVKKLVEAGATQQDAKESCEHLKKLQRHEYEYLKELLVLMSKEIVNYHVEIGKREARIHDLTSEVGNKYRFHNMIGKSKNMQQIYHLLSKISNTEATILIQGENGTGKELVAKAIHYNSNRKDAVFMAVNCSAFNDNLLESELFGHAKGSFTGAIKDKKGVFETANGGTLFLDEIGDTTPSMQVKLLRVLQEGTFLPVGATQSKKVNVRVVAATNKNLKEMIAKGEFREDLYYRINVINVQLPPLRDRQDDIPILVDYFLEKRCAEMGKPLKQFAKKTMEKILDYRWPGNVRELENEVERLVVLAGDDKVINPEILNSRILESVEGPIHSSKGFHGLNIHGSLKDALEQLELIMIKEGLKRCNFNKSKLAKELEISRAGLIMKVEKYGLDKRKKAVGEED